MRPPLDGPGWITLMAALEALALRIGAPMAAAKLKTELENGRLRSASRNLTTGERERLELLFWRGHGIDVIRSFGSVRELDLIDLLTDVVVEGLEFLVWGADLERLFGISVAALDHDDHHDADRRADHNEAPILAIGRATAVLRDLYPTKAQLPATLKEAANAVTAACRKRGWLPPSNDTVARALEDLGHRAPRKRR